MNHLVTYGDVIWLNESKTKKGADTPETPAELRDAIPHMTKLSDDQKEEAVKLVNDLSKKNKGQLSGLGLHADLKKKIKEKGLPDGFSMGIDKDGFYIHTHRARSKSFKTPGAISVKAIRFIDSTG